MKDDVINSSCMGTSVTLAPAVIDFLKPSSLIEMNCSGPQSQETLRSF